MERHVTTPYNCALILGLCVVQDWKGAVPQELDGLPRLQGKRHTHGEYHSNL